MVQDEAHEPTPYVPRAGAEPPPRPAPPWLAASAQPEHPLASLDGRSVGEDVSLVLWFGPRNSVGARYFRLYLRAGEGEQAVQSREPVVFGMANRGPYPGYNWVEVLDYRAHLEMSDGRVVQVPPGIELSIVEALASLVPPGGHLMMEYDSPARRLTAQALALRVPPVATPLGTLMERAGCGTAFRDWYIPEGGREGPRKLQGFRAIDAEHQRRRDEETAAALETYLADRSDIDWAVQSTCRPLAQAALDRIRARLGGGEDTAPAH